MRPRLPEIEHEEPQPNERRFTCRTCEKVWPYRRKFTSGDSNLCLNCRRADRRQKTKPVLTRNIHLKKKYNLTREQFDTRLQHQANVCAICPQSLEHSTSNQSGSIENRAVVDHDHSTGKVRGLLCGHCNVGLGAFKDDTKLLARAIAYLRWHERLIACDD